MDQYAALLYAKWEAGMTGEDITGQWAEDGSKYAVKVPHQLRDLLVQMQNELCERFAELEDARRKLAFLEQRAKGVFH
jgi:hypothetical protein